MITRQCLRPSTVPVPAPMIRANVTGLVYAGTPLSLTCAYTLSPSVNTQIQLLVTWSINDTVVSTSENSHISTNGAALVFSPYTSDTGRYTCTLTVIVSLQTPYVTTSDPVQSPEEFITVQSKFNALCDIMLI